MDYLTEWKLTPPIRKQSKFHNEIVYTIPCKVISIQDNFGSNTHKIRIEHLDFKTGRAVVSDGITYEGTIKNIEEYNIEFPFETTCDIRRLESGEVRFEVYAIGKKISLVKAFIVPQIFKDNYKELNSWIENSDASQSENEELRF